MVYEEAPRIEIELENLAWIASGGKDIDSLHERLYSYDVDAIKRVFTEHGFPWGKLIEHDAQNILMGRPREYFLDHQEWARLYLIRRGAYSEPSPSEDVRSLIYTPEESYDALLKMLRRRREQYEKYGITSHFFEMGHACFREQQYFYGTEEWKRRAKAARAVWGYRCASCKATDMELHVHHATPIISMFHWNFDLNFADWKLKALCRDCHRELHTYVGRDMASYNFVSMSPEELEKQKEELRKLDWLVHEELDICEFCQRGIAERYPNAAEY